MFSGKLNPNIVINMGRYQVGNAILGQHASHACFQKTKGTDYRSFHDLHSLLWMCTPTSNMYGCLEGNVCHGCQCFLRASEMVVNWLLYSSSSVEPSNCERCTCSAGYVITVSISDSSKYSLWCHSMRYPAVENGLGHQRHRSSQTGYRCS